MTKELTYIKMNPNLVHKCVVECDWWEAQEWCKEHAGEFNQDWIKLGIDPAASLFGDKTTTWYFRDPKIATMFLLRWS